jgi:hypothetical protein
LGRGPDTKNFHGDTVALQGLAAHCGFPVSDYEWDDTHRLQADREILDVPFSAARAEGGYDKRQIWRGPAEMILAC